jgi:hypothetical protein
MSNTRFAPRKTDTVLSLAILATADASKIVKVPSKRPKRGFTVGKSSHVVKG